MKYLQGTEVNKSEKAVSQFFFCHDVFLGNHLHCMDQTQYVCMVAKLTKSYKIKQLNSTDFSRSCQKNSLDISPMHIVFFYSLC